MVKLNSNREYSDYIKRKMSLGFDGIEILCEDIDNLPNNNFVIDILLNDDLISFVKDRGYIELRIKSGNEYVDLNSIDNRINDFILSVDSIDYYIDFFKRYYDMPKTE